MTVTSADQELFVGVDGGQSSTLTVLAAGNGEILAGAVTGPCNHIHEPGGLERQFNALRQGCELAFHSAGRPLSRLKGVCLGLTGSGHRPTVESVYDAARIDLMSDLPTALSGAIPSLEGVIVIAGTGSAAYGQNAAGVAARAGGQGYYAGDEGSAFDIARHAFRAVFQAADGRGSQTSLGQRLLAHYECATLTDLRKRIYSDLSRDQLAKAAAIVGQAALEGDAVASTILEQAGVELGRAIAAVLRQIEWLNTPVPIAPIGGVFRAGTLILDPMLAWVKQTNPDAYLITPRFQPAIGALLLSFRAAGHTINDELIHNIDLTKHRITSKL